MQTTYPTATLFHVDHETVWLHSPLQNFMDKSSLPTSPVKMPTGEEVLGDSKFGKVADTLPGTRPHEEARAWTPRCSNAVSSTILGMGASDV